MQLFVLLANDVFERTLVEGVERHGLVPIIELGCEFVEPTLRSIFRGQLLRCCIDWHRFIDLTKCGMKQLRTVTSLVPDDDPPAGPSYHSDCGIV